jgi:hypothetical protein
LERAISIGTGTECKCKRRETYLSKKKKKKKKTSRKGNIGGRRVGKSGYIGTRGIETGKVEDEASGSLGNRTRLVDSRYAMNK